MSPENRKTTLEHISPKNSSLREAIFYLADISNPVALTIEKVNPNTIKKSLEKNGLKIDNLSPEATLSLAKTQFRNFDSPQSRGFGVKEALGNEFYSWQKQTELLSGTYTWSIDGDKARGLKQLTADIIACAADIITPKDFINRTNRRFWKEHERKGKLTSNQLQNIFQNTTPPEKTTASFPLNAGVMLISYLIDEN